MTSCMLMTSFDDVIHG